MTGTSFSHEPVLLVLTGFMGTGKTSVGRVLAERLGREFVDMDVLIEEEEGMPVQQIFETRGEQYFREREADVCRRLAGTSYRVIATGGGTLVNPANRAKFKDALIVCLDAEPEEIISRLQASHGRPLLATTNPRQRIVELMDARRNEYSQIEWHLDTTGKTVDQVAAEVAEVLQPRKLNVSAPETMCPMFLGPGLLAQAGKLMNLTTDTFSPRCAVVTDARVREIYATRLMDSLRSRGLEPHLIEIPDDERLKSLDTVQRVYDELLNAELDRHSIIFALGGGAIGDIAGFAAATFMRGISFVQMPTTLLAMVDDSIGGKVAVDHPRGKNLIGAFKHPYAVIADTDTLATLSHAEIRSGMAEIVKHGIIGDPELFEQLERNPAGPSPSIPEGRHWIARAMQVKIDIVARDPFELGERGKLNLGHTFGHAFETISGSELLHGEAVAMGLACAARLAAQRQICTQELAVRIEHLLDSIGLPTRIPPMMSTEAILEAMAKDKKRVARQLRFVLPAALGDVAIVDNVATEDVAVAIEQSRRGTLANKK